MLALRTSLLRPDKAPKFPVGPTGSFAALSGLSKLVLTANMLLGRLEVLPLLVLLFPSMWKKR